MAFRLRDCAAACSRVAITIKIVTMKRLAQFISFVFSPLLIPTYGVWLALWTTVLVLIPVNLRWGVTAVVFILTCLLPLAAIFVLLKLKLVTDPGLNKQNERFIPYLITSLCYAGCALYLYFVHAPLWMSMFMVGGLLASIVSLVVNHWWKISAHMAAVGGLAALMFRIMTDHYGLPFDIWVLIGVVMVVGLVGTSRLLLERHTLGQVAAGTLNGFLCVYLMSAI